MKLKITSLAAATLSLALFSPLTSSACDGACGGGNGQRHHRHAFNQNPQQGAGQGLNNGVNLSLDQNKQGHTWNHGKKWGNWHNKQNNQPG